MLTSTPFGKKIGILRGQTSSMKYSPTSETSTKEVKEQAENGRRSQEVEGRKGIRRRRRKRRSRGIKGRGGVGGIAATATAAAAAEEAQHDSTKFSLTIVAGRHSFSRYLSTLSRRVPNLNSVIQKSTSGRQSTILQYTKNEQPQQYFQPGKITEESRFSPYEVTRQFNQVVRNYSS
ncbi:hypothetical protein PoB_002085300 [Plakobranchus ocellatus]|uniref:Uncharacterized protein n=1 Tax=Plakobranchus ocellatus TaxID=259542 RepID=A0AAV3ZIL1_9GAST|nr:hypothetical protein PoB_002085300 [Plakobranchus ocellatus]